MDEKKHDQAAKEGCDKSKVQSDPKMDPPTSPLALTIGPSASSSNPQPPKEPLEQQLSKFWAKQHQEVEETSESRNHCLPLARIKKIMKSDEDVRMVSAEAPVLLAKACEMFIMELTMRAWANVEENKRRTLSKNDIAAAMSKTDMYDFLVDIVPREETRGPQVFAGQQSGAPTMLMGMPLLDPTDPEQLQDRPSPTPMLPIPEEEDNPSPDSDD
ncbi:nuclear transcription factor Y subunit C-6-like [Vigna radiata var. radiata]|uniref:Nuclear transcription factor Y subunit C-6-like n=1 Tax=Vigna radiata var. radiata TaxID=3916 RepID=A0A3Q0FG99_VIGRR|nr:nuclear transcription factor Y subunit C-6-like [Vigna radiata var. radiata]